MRNWVLAIPAAMAVFTGCSVATPDTSQRALHYSGGPLSSQNFEDCIEPGTRDVTGPADFNYYYPAGQRTYTFSDRPGSDSPPIMVSSQNEGGVTELVVRGTVTFVLNTNCEPYRDDTGRYWAGGRFQKFHDTLGRQNAAFATAGGQAQPAGWSNVLDLYVGAPAERAMDNAGLNYGWQQLYGDVNSKNAWTATVEEQLPKLIREQAGDEFFLVSNIQIDKPDVPNTLKTELEAGQAAALRQQAAESFPGGLAAYQDDQQKQALNRAIVEGKVAAVPIPFGSPIIVAPPAGG